MRCVICRHGETLEGSATVTLSRDGTMLVVKGVPARVCENFGEEYVDEEITGRLMQAAEEGARGGVEVDVSSTWHDHTHLENSDNEESYWNSSEAKPISEEVSGLLSGTAMIHRRVNC